MLLSLIVYKTIETVAQITFLKVLLEKPKSFSKSNFYLGLSDPLKKSLIKSVKICKAVAVRKGKWARLNGEQQHKSDGSFLPLWEITLCYWHPLAVLLTTGLCTSGTLDAEHGAASVPNIHRAVIFALVQNYRE